MPTGAIINSSAVLIGGMAGAILGEKLPGNLKETLNLIFGLCAMAMGITNIVLMKNMPAVVLSAILGTAIGILLHFDELINGLGRGLLGIMDKLRLPMKKGLDLKEFNQRFLTVIVMFCASGTGIYGAIVSGMNGDHSILITKAILDLFTAMIFACELGFPVSLIAIPQFLIMLCLFLGGDAIFSLTTDVMINDFKAVGGLLMIASGFRMIRVKNFPIAEMIPGMIIAMPISWIWTSFIAPLL